MNFAAVFSWHSTCPVNELMSILMHCSLCGLQSSKIKLCMGLGWDRHTENQPEMNIPAPSPSRELNQRRHWGFGEIMASRLAKAAASGLSPCRSLMISAQSGGVLSTPLKSAFSEMPPCRHSPADSHLLPPTPSCSHSSDGTVKWVKNSTMGSCLQERWFALCLW